MILVLFLGITLAGCASEAEKAFERCVEQTVKSVSDEISPDLDLETAQDFRDANRAIAEKTCAVVKRHCENDPEGDLCRSMLERYP